MGAHVRQQVFLAVFGKIRHMPVDLLAVSMLLGMLIAKLEQHLSGTDQEFCLEYWATIHFAGRNISTCEAQLSSIRHLFPAQCW